MASPGKSKMLDQLGVVYESLGGLQGHSPDRNCGRSSQKLTRISESKTSIMTKMERIFGVGVAFYVEMKTG